MSRKIYVVYASGSGEPLAVETTDTKAKSYCFDNQKHNTTQLNFKEFVLGGSAKPRVAKNAVAGSGGVVGHIETGEDTGESPSNG